MDSLDLKEQLSKYLKYYQDSLCFEKYGIVNKEMLARANEVLLEVYKSLYKPLELFNPFSLTDCTIKELKALQGFLEDCMIVFSNHTKVLNNQTELIKKNTEAYLELVKENLNLYKVSN